MKILQSASKFVFVVLAIASCVGLFTGNVSENNFMLLATGAFAFYFSKPMSVQPIDSPENK